MKTKFYLIPIICLFFAGCGKVVNDEDNVKVQVEERHDIVLTKAQKEYVKKGNELSYALLLEVAKQEEVSFTVSPLSLEYVLAMLSNGAKGNTQLEILEALGYESGELEEVNKFYQYLTDALYKVDSSVDLCLANTIVVNSAFATLNDNYVDAVHTYYDALIAAYNFANNAGEALSAINKWASDNTKGLIPTLVDEFDPLARMILANALYFKGAWNSSVEFKSSDTKEEYFYRADGSKKKNKFMNTEARVGFHSRGNGYQAVRLPYGNGAFVLDILLPDENEGIDVVLNAKDEDLSFTPLKVKLRIPKFEITTGIKLNDILYNLNIKSMFTLASDFKGIFSDDSNALVNKVFQKSVFKIDEKGTEGATVTYVDLIAGANLGREPSIPTFYATRPFIYIIREVSTNAILFAGAYNGN